MDELQARARAAYLSLDDDGRNMAVAILEAWAAPAKAKEMPIKAPVLVLVPRSGRKSGLGDFADRI